MTTARELCQRIESETVALNDENKILKSRNSRIVAESEKVKIISNKFRENTNSLRDIVQQEQQQRMDEILAVRELDDQINQVH